MSETERKWIREAKKHTVKMAKSPKPRRRLIGWYAAQYLNQR